MFNPSIRLTVQYIALRDMRLPEVYFEPHSGEPVVSPPGKDLVVRIGTAMGGQ